jgi:hypothetical protein
VVVEAAFFIEGSPVQTRAMPMRPVPGPKILPRASLARVRSLQMAKGRMDSWT